MLLFIDTIAIEALIFHYLILFKIFYHFERNREILFIIYLFIATLFLYKYIQCDEVKKRIKCDIYRKL